MVEEILKHRNLVEKEERKTGLVEPGVAASQGGDKKGGDGCPCG